MSLEIDMLLDGLRVVLVNSRFPENVGMAVRACVNMGCPELTLVAPERWSPEKAAPLATPKGLALLRRIPVFETLADASGDCHLIIATTARIGGWRRALLSPEQGARLVFESLSRGEKAAFVFGSEDHGLDNTQIERCQQIVTIPTSCEATSLNLAQSVLLILYECAKKVRAMQQELIFRQGTSDANMLARPEQDSTPGITGQETERLMDSFKNALLLLDILHGDNPEYFLMTWRRFFARARLRRHEYDAFMGLCRQIKNKIKFNI